ncbi:Inner centromere protein, ARK-binding domain-containing protein [Strongyloides ratti]|uniref:Inner centromere protein, ARK-binding domain-containing protein n=1 Tax=Strongyloides ratti TaxID=34506 RepID=A0A090L9D5_STRRB|nr:Inner centromere protein, ARK-binding domain-containing protein [Strongyloides ratti]CEF66401.1 Inner centromere protein, ARK-binding domain-containing protein [Strongyloides ratti]
MPKKNYKRRKIGITIKNEKENQFLNLLSDKEFILSTKHGSYLNNIPCKEELSDFTGKLEEIYEKYCLNIEDNILLKLWNQRGKVKCFVNEHDNMIKIPPTPSKGKNISQIDIMKQNITERKEFLELRTTINKNDNNSNNMINTCYTKNHSETNVNKNNNTNNTFSNSKCNVISNFGKKRRNTAEREMCIEEQMGTLIQADLRRKMLLDEKVKRIKLEREEKMKQVKEKLRQQEINPMNKKSKLLQNKDVVEKIKKSKLPPLTQKSTKNFFNEQQDTKNNLKYTNNKLTNFNHSKKPNVIYENKNKRKRKSDMKDEIKFLIPPVKNGRYSESSDNMFIQNNKPLINCYTNINKFNDNSKKLTNKIDNESYKIENISDCDTTDDENNPFGIVPKWAQFENLKNSLIHQSKTFNSLTKIENVFGSFCFFKLRFPSNESHI